MRLYSANMPAPNPRRVRIFAAKKGIALAEVMLSLPDREHRSAAHSAAIHWVRCRSLNWTMARRSPKRSRYADIAAVTVIDFAALIGLNPVAGNPAVAAWHARVSSRPSVLS